MFESSPVENLKTMKNLIKFSEIHNYSNFLKSTIFTYLTKTGIILETFKLQKF